MGAWGTALFSDDTARDVRDSYIDLVGDGLTGPEATKALLREWAASLDDPDESPVFWLALAATQWRCGRLESHVLQQALNVIDSGSDFSRKVVGWSLDRTLASRLAMEALEKAIATREPLPGLVHHCDRGVQYASEEYVAVLEKHGLISSMSRPANPYDNASCEAF